MRRSRVGHFTESDDVAEVAQKNRMNFVVFSALIPILWMLIVIVAASKGGGFGQWVLNAETGLQETVTGLLALAAAIVALVAFFHPTIRQDWKTRTWLSLFAVAAIFFAGEDLNWGQYYFGWTAPEFFQAHNREHETNLHNMSSWFNQKPRLVAELWLLIAGILVPLGWKLPQRLTARFLPGMFWPDNRLTVAASLAAVAKLNSTLVKQAGVGLLAEIRWSEVVEFFLAYAMLLYTLMLLARIAAIPRNEFE